MWPQSYLEPDIAPTIKKSQSLRTEASRGLLRLVNHQLAARGVTFLRDLVEGDDDSFAARSGFFDQRVGDPLCDLAFLIGGTALQHCDLNHRHRGSSRFSVVSSQQDSSRSQETEN